MVYKYKIKYEGGSMLLSNSNNLSIDQCVKDLNDLIINLGSKEKNYFKELDSEDIEKKFLEFNEIHNKLVEKVNKFLRNKIEFYNKFKFNFDSIKHLNNDDILKNNYEFNKDFNELKISDNNLLIEKKNYKDKFNFNFDINFDYDINFLYVNYLMYTLEKYMLVDFVKLDKLIDEVTKIYRDINPEIINNSTGNNISEDYIIKKILPSNSKIIYLGDYHSSIHSLIDVIQQLKNNKILNNNYQLIENHYLVFLGDIVDRGPYGIECLYIIYMLFYINNQKDEKVFILNGNHEEKNTYSMYGFNLEMNNQLNSDLKQKLENLIEYLPLALFVKKNGSKWYQFCHGGIDYHHTKNNFLRDFLDDNYNNSLIKLDYNNINLPKGFLWSDFCNINSNIYRINNLYGNFTNSNFNPIDTRTGRPFHNNIQINQILNELNINTIISGHQDKTNYAFLLKDDNFINYNLFKFDENYLDFGLLTFNNKLDEQKSSTSISVSNPRKQIYDDDDFDFDLSYKNYNTKYKLLDESKSSNSSSVSKRDELYDDFDLQFPIDDFYSKDSSVHRKMNFKNIFNETSNSKINLQEELKNEIIYEVIDTDDYNVLKSYKIKMDKILVSVMSSATISKNVPYSIYGLLDLEKDESYIIYLNENIIFK